MDLAALAVLAAFVALRAPATLPVVLAVRKLKASSSPPLRDATHAHARIRIVLLGLDLASVVILAHALSLRMLSNELEH